MIRRRIHIICSFVVLLGFLCIPKISAHQPIVNETTFQLTWDVPARVLYASSRPIGDPTFASLAVYSSITKEKGIDMYVFMPHKSEDIPLEILVPAKKRFEKFRPTALIIGHNLAADPPESLPIKIPLNFSTLALESQKQQVRTRYFEPYSLQVLFHGVKKQVAVTDGSIYFIAVYESSGETGDYTLSLGDTDNFTARAKDINPYALNINALRFENEDNPGSISESDVVTAKSTNPSSLITKIGDMTLLWTEMALFYIGRLGSLASL